MGINEKLTSIANAIRRKTGKNGTLTLDQMATEINGIQTSTGGGGASGDWYIWERCNIAMISDTYELTWGENKQETLSNIDYTGETKLKIFADYILEGDKITLTNPLSSSQSDKAAQFNNYSTHPYFYEDKMDGATNATVRKITNMTKNGSEFMATYTRYSDKAILTAAEPHPGKGEVIENVASLESTTYPEDGEQGEYWYQKV